MVYLRYIIGSVVIAIGCAYGIGCGGGGDSGESDAGGVDVRIDAASIDAGVDVGIDAGADGADTTFEPTISAGHNYTCMVTRSGAALCWGQNEYGKLGDGTITNRPSPTKVQGLSAGVRTISAGRYHTCAILSDGSARCWGRNTYGQLGTDDTAQRSSPSPVHDLANAVAISAGSDHTCAIESDGSVKCWGDNMAGQLGDGTNDPRLVPTAVVGLGAKAIAVTTGDRFTCAVVQGGAAKCWGRNNSGNLGNNSSLGSNQPVQVEGLTQGVVSIASGAGHTCALDSNGAVSCWGYNEYGQVGDGTLNNTRTSPKLAQGVSGAVSVAAGDYHSCAILADGSAMCWGYNLAGLLGVDPTVVKFEIPNPVVGLTLDILDMGLGGNHSCAILSDDSFTCWGAWGFDGSGQLGDG